MNLSSANSQEILGHDVYDPNAEANFLDIAIQSYIQCDIPNLYGYRYELKICMDQSDKTEPKVLKTFNW